MHLQPPEYLRSGGLRVAGVANCYRHIAPDGPLNIASTPTSWMWSRLGITSQRLRFFEIRPIKTETSPREFLTISLFGWSRSQVFPFPHFQKSSSEVQHVPNDNHSTGSVCTLSRLL